MAGDLLTDPKRRSERFTVFVTPEFRERLRSAAQFETFRRGRRVSESEIVRAAVERGLDQLERTKPHQGR